ncbi:MAG: hypothetical protein ACXVC1_02895 [Tumebacillaceae bacterium]
MGKVRQAVAVRKQTPRANEQDSAPIERTSDRNRSHVHPVVAQMMQLQQSHGNRAVVQMVQAIQLGKRKGNKKGGASGDKRLKVQNADEVDNEIDIEEANEEQAHNGLLAVVNRHALAVQQSFEGLVNKMAEAKDGIVERGEEAQLQFEALEAVVDQLQQKIDNAKQVAIDEVPVRSGDLDYTRIELGELDADVEDKKEEERKAAKKPRVVTRTNKLKESTVNANKQDHARIKEELSELKREYREKEVEIEELANGIPASLAAVREEINTCKFTLYKLQNPRNVGPFAHVLPDITQQHVQQTIAGLTDSDCALFKGLLKASGLATYEFAEKKDAITAYNGNDSSNAMQVGTFGFGSTGAESKAVKTPNVTVTPNYSSHKAKPWGLPGEDPKVKGETRTNVSGLVVGGVASYDKEETTVKNFLQKNGITEALLAELLLKNSAAEIHGQVALLGKTEQDTQKITDFVNRRRVLINLETARNRSSGAFHVLAMQGVQNGWEHGEGNQAKPFSVLDYYAKNGALNPMAPENATAKGDSWWEKQQHATAKRHRRDSQFRILKGMLQHFNANFEQEIAKDNATTTLVKATVNYAANHQVNDDAKNVLKDAFINLLNNR